MWLERPWFNPARLGAKGGAPEGNRMEPESDPRTERVRRAARAAAEGGPHLQQARCDLVDLLLGDIDTATARTFQEYCPDEDTSGEHPAIFQGFLERKLGNPRFLGQLAAHPNPIAFVHTTVRNLTIDYLRKRLPAPLPLTKKASRGRREQDPFSVPDEKGAAPDHRLVIDEAHAVDLTTLDEVLESYTVEQRVLVKAVVTGGEGWSEEEVGHVAARRGATPEDLRREIAERRSRFEIRRRAFLEMVEKHHAKVMRLHGQLSRAITIARECGDEHLRGTLDEMTLTEEQVARFRQSSQKLRKATPAERRAFRIYLENKLADALRSRNNLLAKERADGLQGGPRWQEVALLTGRVDAGASREEIQRAANTTQQTYRRLMAKIAGEMEALLGDAGR